MLRKRVNRQSPYGTLAWQMKVSRELGLESTLRPRVRPRKRIVRARSYIFADLEIGRVPVLLLAASDAEPAPLS